MGVKILKQRPGKYLLYSAYRMPGRIGKRRGYPTRTKAREAARRYDEWGNRRN